VEIERVQIAPVLLGELHQARVTHDAQKSVISKSLEKERAKLDEIQEMSNYK
jgi:hypothetical protein